MMRSKQRGAAAKPPASLLRLHRHSLVSVLVTGGAAREREAMARAFHRASPLRDRPFMTLDCGRDESTLRRALQGWLLPARGVPFPIRSATSKAARCFSIGWSGSRRRPSSSSWCWPTTFRAVPGRQRTMPARLAAGSAAPLLDDSPKGIAPELLDCLDKIRVEVGVAVAGVVKKRAAEAGRAFGRASPE